MLSTNAILYTIFERQFSMPPQACIEIITRQLKPIHCRECFQKDSILCQQIVTTYCFVQVEGSSVVDISAVQFCARKIAAVSGDMRKALDICRRAVEVVETDARRQQVLKPIDPSKQFYYLFSIHAFLLANSQL